MNGESLSAGGLASDWFENLGRMCGVNCKNKLGSPVGQICDQNSWNHFI